MSTTPACARSVSPLGRRSTGSHRQSPSARKRECVLRLPVRADPLHVPRETRALKGRDHDAREVDLTAAHAVDRRGGKRMMIVVPRLAERERGEPGEVLRMVVGFKPLATEEMTQ